MDTALSKALKRHDELSSELAELEQFIKTYERLTGEDVPRHELILGQKYGETTGTPIETTKKKRRRNNINKIYDVSERLINEAGRPLTRTEIAAGMDRLNIVVHATDIPKYLGTLLWRNADRFISRDGDGYLTKELDSILSSHEKEPSILTAATRPPPPLNTTPSLPNESHAPFIDNSPDDDDDLPPK